MVLTAAGDDQGDWLVIGTILGWRSWREHLRVVLSNKQGLVSSSSFPAPNDGYDVLRIAECDLYDSLTLMELRLLLTNEHPEAESRVPEVHFVAH